MPDLRPSCSFALAVGLLAAVTACSDPPAGKSGAGAADADASADVGALSDSAAADSAAVDAVPDAAAPDGTGPLVDTSADTGGLEDAPTAAGDTVADADTVADVPAVVDATGKDDGDDDGAPADVAPAEDTAPGPPDDGPSCQSAFDSVAQIPATADLVDFETCSGCACCVGSAYPAEMLPDCLTCTVAGALAEVGATLQGGLATTLVGCVTGNAAAPMSGQALFVGSGLVGPSGLPALQVALNPPALIFGFSAVLTASVAQPKVVLRGYDAQGALIAEDTFDFAGVAGGQCDTTNPAAQFFGFRPCQGGLMHAVVVEVTDGNVALDNVRVWRP